jgi:D-amino-acid dehydrogenase
MKNIAIIGGGVIGLLTAYFLQKNGHRVTIIEKNDLTKGCSFGNAGLIVPSHIIPLASPGTLHKGLKWLFNPKAPLAFDLPPSYDLIKWGSKFIRIANSGHVKRSILPIRDLSLLSKALYQKIVDEESLSISLEHKGLLMLYRTEKSKKEELEAAEIARKIGMEAKVLQKNEIEEMEDEIDIDVLGGVHYPQDDHLDPNQLMNNLITLLESKGVKIYSNTSLISLVCSGKKVTEIVTEPYYDLKNFDEVIISAGSWSAKLMKLLNVNIHLQPGKGYSFTFELDKKIKVPSILTEARVSVTPFASGITRFGGGMELGFFEEKIFSKRLNQIFSSISTYYPGIKKITIDHKEVWQGLRPCSFDGLPYIGRVPSMENVILATGHAMMGITLAPATGKLISEIVDEVPTSIDLQPFKVLR